LEFNFLYTTNRQAREGNEAGHACGHHLFGTGSSAAAIAVKEWLQRTGHTGTIRLYGTPAEETAGDHGSRIILKPGINRKVKARVAN